MTEDYIQDINAGGISSEGLLEQLEDRNDEDYSEYLEVLEETTADPVLDRDSMELNDNDGVVKKRGGRGSDAERYWHVRAANSVEIQENKTEEDEGWTVRDAYDL